MPTESLLHDTVELLKQMVRTPSISSNENDVACYLESQLGTFFPGCVSRSGNNLIVDIAGKKTGATLLLCSHIDTVAVANGWTRDPFGAEVDGDKIFGLGANDAGASVVSMIAAARQLGAPETGRLILCLAAEEEAGNKGFATVEKLLPRYDNAIFGEPTDMGVASAMRGSMRAVMHSHGKACHASRPWEGQNACDQFADDLHKLRCIDVKDTSPWGGTTIEPTIVRGGESSNQIPDLIETTLDIRTTPEKNNDWVKAELTKAGIDFSILFDRRKPMQNDPSSKIIQAVRRIPDLPDYTFNGTCDMALATAPSIVMGPGKSERSHAADEFIAIPEIAEAIDAYAAVLRAYFAA